MNTVPPKIIFENDDVLVVNKPAGLVVHADGRTEQYTLAQWVAENFPHMQNVGEPMLVRIGKEDKKIDRPGIVHRLDRDTSGVMILAKNQKAFEFLKQQFQDRLVQKTYVAAVWGNIIEDKGMINEPIGKSRTDIRKWQAGDNPRGTLRPAETSYRVLQRVSQDGEHFCIVEVSPKTGRTHQIRVHMKYIHHPIVGDPIYAGKRPAALGFSSLALHSWKLQITLPNGTLETFMAEPPIRLRELAKDSLT